MANPLAIKAALKVLTDSKARESGFKIIIISVMAFFFILLLPVIIISSLFSWVFGESGDPAAMCPYAQAVETLRNEGCEIPPDFDSTIFRTIEIINGSFNSSPELIRFWILDNFTLETVTGKRVMEKNEINRILLDEPFSFSSDTIRKLVSDTFTLKTYVYFRDSILPDDRLDASYMETSEVLSDTYELPEDFDPYYITAIKMNYRNIFNIVLGAFDLVSFTEEHFITNITDKSKLMDYEQIYERIAEPPFSFNNEMVGSLKEVLALSENFKNEYKEMLME